jgi:hypothetical protein
MDKFKELLESEMLGEDVRKAIQEAWEAKLEEARKSEKEKVEQELREEFASLYQRDKDDLVEAMNRMVTDAASKYAKEQVAETRKLKEERERLTKTIKEQRVFYRNHLREHIAQLNRYVVEKLREEISGLAIDHEAMRKQRVVLAQQIREGKKVYTSKIKEHTSKLQRFILEQFHNELQGVAHDHVKLNEQRMALIKEAREQKVQHKIAIREHQEKLKSFVLGRLTNEMREIETQKVALAEQKIALVKHVKEHRADLTKQTAETVTKLKNFVVEHMRKELVGLEEDRKELLEHKVRMIAEGRRQIEEQRRAFVQRASTVLEEKIRANMCTAMTQLKEDIQFARENIFGRKLFEAFQAEFMSSYLSEGTHIKKLSAKLLEAKKQMEQVNSETNTLRVKLEEQQKLIDAANRKAILAEDRAARTKTITELLSKLQGDKRAVMAELLESVKTSQLKEAFHKYLPTVLNETRTAKQKTTTLLNNNRPEMLVEKHTVATGNRPNRLSEAVSEEQNNNKTDDEILELRRLAGLN